MGENIFMHNKEIPIIKINKLPEQRSKKCFEYEKLKKFLNSYYEIFQEFFLGKEIEIIVEESPDFIIKTDDKKVGVELTEDINKKIIQIQNIMYRIYNKTRNFVEREKINIAINLNFSKNMTVISIDKFMSELKGYIMKRMNKECKSFCEYCSKSKSSSICYYLLEDPFSGDKMENPFVTMAEAPYYKKIYNGENIKKIIEEKIKKVPCYKQKVDNINLLIYISLLKASTIEFLPEDQHNIRKIIKGLNNKEGFNNIYIFYDKNFYNTALGKFEGPIIIKVY